MMCYENGMQWLNVRLHIGIFKWCSTVFPKWSMYHSLLRRLEKPVWFRHTIQVNHQRSSFSVDILKTESPLPSILTSKFLHLTQRSCFLSNTFISSLAENLFTLHRFGTTTTPRSPLVNPLKIVVQTKTFEQKERSSCPAHVTSTPTRHNRWGNNVSKIYLLFCRVFTLLWHLSAQGQELLRAAIPTRTNNYWCTSSSEK